MTTAAVAQLGAWLREDLARQAAAEEQELRSLVGREALLWLAAPPAWPVEVLRRCAGAAPWPSDVDELLPRLVEAGVLTEDAPGSVVVSGSRRRRIVDDEVSGGRADDLLRVVRDVGRAALDVGGELPTVFRRWALLASEAADGADSLLVEGVEEALRRQDLVQVAHWLEAARPLAALLQEARDASLTLAVQQVSRRLEMVHRDEHDRRMLRGYLPRGQQRTAFEALMEDADGTGWALHFLGEGGVGKTMLMRDIGAELAERHDAVAARIDFDYLHPDYPALAPGLLLWAFGLELRRHDRRGTFARHLDAADRALRELHTQLRSEPVSASRVRPTDRPAFREAVERYQGAIADLQEQGRRVVLVLDTCEELAKASPRGTQRNVDETFRILRGLHDGPAALDRGEDAPTDERSTLRVVLSGRRPLASSGHGGWTLPAAGLPARPYLRLHRVEPFDPEEAERLLDRLQPPAETRAAVLRGSRRSVPGQSTLRYSPYELQRRARWAQEDPPPPAEVLAADSTTYVQERVVRRLHSDPVAPLLPTLALLGEVTDDLLRAVHDRLPREALDAAVESARRQEWVDYRLEMGGDGRPRLVLLVDADVRHGLLAYYEGSGALAPIESRVASLLEELTLQEDLAEVPVATVDAAVRVLGRLPDTERAVAWWRRFERRLWDGSRPLSWSVPLLQHVCGDAGAAGAGAGGVLRPLVLATYAAVLARTDRAARVRDAWAEVERSSHLLPAPELRAELALRAAAAGITLPAWLEDPEPDSLGSFWSRVDAAPLDLLRDPQVAAAVVAAAEVLVDAAEDGPRPTEPAVHRRVLELFRRLVEALTDASDLESRQVLAAARVLAFRSRCLTQTAGPQDYDEVMAALADLPAEAGTFLDWQPPADLALRLLLEVTRIASRAVPPAAVLQDPRGLDLLGARTGGSGPPAADLEGLLSARLGLALDDRPLAARRELSRVPLRSRRAKGRAPDPGLGAEAALAGETPRPPAHRRLPRLDVAVATAELALAQVAPGFGSLKELARLRRGDRLEELTDLAYLEAVRTLRLREAGERPVREGDGHGDAVLAAAWMLDGLYVDAPPLTTPPRPAELHAGQLHAAWRATPAARVAELGDELRRARSRALDDGLLDDAERDALLLDEEEHSLVAVLPSPLLAAGAAAGHAARDPEALLRFALRRSALTGEPTPVSAGLAERIGPRRAARIAHDEGEALALRLPAQGAALLLTACRAYASCHDPLGRLLAAVTGALLVARDHEGLALAEHLAEHAVTAYADLREVVPELPPTLAAIRVDDEVLGVVWRPLLGRLAVLNEHLVSEAGPGTAAARAPSVVALVEALTPALLPFEFAALLPDAPPERSERALGRGARRTAPVDSIAPTAPSPGLPGAPPTAPAAPRPSPIGPGDDDSWGRTTRDRALRGRGMSRAARWSAIAAGFGLTAAVALGQVQLADPDPAPGAQPLPTPGATASPSLRPTPTSEAGSTPSPDPSPTPSPTVTPEPSDSAESPSPGVDQMDDDVPTEGAGGLPTAALPALLGAGVGAAVLVRLRRRREVVVRLRIGQELGAAGAATPLLRLELVRPGAPHPPAAVAVAEPTGSVRGGLVGLLPEISRALGPEIGAARASADVLTVVLEAPERAHRWEWEALLEGALLTHLSGRGMTFLRTVPPRVPGTGATWRRGPGTAPTAPAAAGRVRPVLAVAGADPEAQEFARRLWSAHDDPEVDATAPPGPSSPGASAARVLHLLGSAEVSPSGVLLRLRGGASPRSGWSRGLKDTLLTAQDIVERFGVATGAVLQVPPGAVRGTRGTSDAEEAGALRVLAAELLTAGFPSVLVVPRLEPRTARELLDHVAEPLLDPAPSLSSLRRAVDGGRSDCAGLGGLTDPWDVALFAHPEHLPQP